MKKIKKLACNIEDEINSACHYAEKYVECKVDGKSDWATKYKAMAQDEIQHAKFLHEVAVTLINKYKTVFTPTNEMLEIWNECHNYYIKKLDDIENILSI